MANPKTRQLTPAELQDDLEAFAGLEGISGYTPANSEYSVAKGATLKATMQGSQTSETQKYNDWQAARDKKVADQWAFHDFIRNARVQVKAQFGEDSDEVASTGLKKKSEYKNKSKKAPAPVA
jgi:hypothetical protein